MCCWRFAGRALLFGVLSLAALGCQPSDNILLSDGENPHLKEGLALVSAMDDKNAVRRFERALEVNPSSIRAHFELGLLEQNFNKDYVSALYHYKKVLELKQSGWPAENVRQLMAGCRQELVRSEAITPTFQAMQRDIDQLRKENDQLRDELASVQKGQTRANLNPVPEAATPVRNEEPPSSPRTTPTPASDPSPSPRPTRPSPNQPYTPSEAVLAMRTGYITHYIKSGETLMALSRKYDVPITSIQAANRGLDPRSLRVGQPVRIPRAR